MMSSSSLPASFLEKSRMSLMMREQCLPGQVDPVHVLSLTLVETGGLKQTREPDHPVHRSADLMAHRGQERRLGPRRLHRGVPARAGFGPRVTLGQQQSGTPGEAEPQQDGHADHRRQDMPRTSCRSLVKCRASGTRIGAVAMPSFQNGWVGRASTASKTAAAPGRRQAAVVIRIAPSIQPASRNAPTEVETVSRFPMSATSQQATPQAKASPMVGSRAASHQHPHDHGQQNRVEDGIGGPHEPGEAGDRGVRDDGRDREVPEDEHTHDDDRERVDDGLWVDPRTGPGADQGAERQCGGQSQVSQEVRRVGHRDVGLIARRDVAEPDQVAERGGGDPGSDEERDAGPTTGATQRPDPRHDRGTADGGQIRGIADGARGSSRCAASRAMATATTETRTRFMLPRAATAWRPRSQRWGRTVPSSCQRPGSDQEREQTSGATSWYPDARNNC